MINGAPILIAVIAALIIVGFALFALARFVRPPKGWSVDDWWNTGQDPREDEAQRLGVDQFPFIHGTAFRQSEQQDHA